MSKVALESLRYYEIVKTLLEQVGILSFALTPLITIPSLVIEFLSSFCLRTTNTNDQNPYYSMRFKLGSKDHFLNEEDFDNIFGFKSE